MDDQPSRTAMVTAGARAAHLLVDREPWIFEDRLAAPLLGEQADGRIAPHRNPAATGLTFMRVAMTARSRYTETRLADALRRGTKQYVILGAGLDSFAYRSPLADCCRIFEVDHPATQSWKRQRLPAASIPVPEQLTFVAVDFAVDSLEERLTKMGFDRSQPAFVSWLGVTQYLTRDAISATLHVIGGFAAATELAMEYLVPAELRDKSGQAGADSFMPRAASFGEPWITFLTPSDTSDLLTAHRLVVRDDVGRKGQIEPTLWHRTDGLGPHELGRVVWAVLSE